MSSKMSNKQMANKLCKALGKDGDKYAKLGKAAASCVECTELDVEVAWEKHNYLRYLFGASFTPISEFSPFSNHENLDEPIGMEGTKELFEERVKDE